jgi:hypothetical protein
VFRVKKLKKAARFQQRAADPQTDMFYSTFILSKIPGGGRILMALMRINVYQVNINAF